MSAMIKDAYSGLEALVRKRLGGGPGAELVLAKHEQPPETWQAPLMAELAETGADGDRDLIVAAQALLDLISKAEGRTGKYTVDVRGHRACRSGITTGRTRCSPPRRTARALQMSRAAEPGDSHTNVRTQAGHGQEATDRNARGLAIHQPVREDPTCSGATVRCGWVVPAECAPPASRLTWVIGPAVTQWTARIRGGSGTAALSAPDPPRRRLDC